MSPEHAFAPALDTLRSKIQSSAASAFGRFSTIPPKIHRLVAWTTEYAGTQVDVPGGYATANAVDPAGNVHLAYWDYQAGKLIYVQKSTGTWSAPAVIDTVNLAGEPGGYFDVALTLDAGGAAHVCYFNWHNGDLKHAQNASGTWNVEVVARGVGLAYSYVDIAIDSAGTLHVIFTQCIEGVPPTIKYVTKTGGTWSGITDVDATSQGVGDPKIAFDAKGILHAIFTCGTQLRYTEKPVGGSWQAPHIIDSGSGAGFFWPSIVVDPSGNLNLSYFDSSHRWVKYATRQGVTWRSPISLSSGFDYGMSSIAANSAGNIGVAFYDSTAQTLNFVWKAQGTWGDIQTVDGTADSGAYCHLSMDSDGSPHITYFRTVGAGPLSLGKTTVLHAWLAPIR